MFIPVPTDTQQIVRLFRGLKSIRSSIPLNIPRVHSRFINPVFSSQRTHEKPSVQDLLRQGEKLGLRSTTSISNRDTKSVQDILKRGKELGVFSDHNADSQSNARSKVINAFLRFTNQQIDRSSAVSSLTSTSSVSSSFSPSAPHIPLTATSTTTTPSIPPPPPPPARPRRPPPTTAKTTVNGKDLQNELSMAFHVDSSQTAKHFKSKIISDTSKNVQTPSTVMNYQDISNNTAVQSIDSEHLTTATVISPSSVNRIDLQKKRTMAFPIAVTNTPETTKLIKAKIFTTTPTMIVTYQDINNNETVQWTYSGHLPTTQTPPPLLVESQVDRKPDSSISESTKNDSSPPVSASSNTNNNAKNPPTILTSYADIMKYFQMPQKASNSLPETQTSPPQLIEVQADRVPNNDRSRLSNSESKASSPGGTNIDLFDTPPLW